jgi:hypothetical protein
MADKISEHLHMHDRVAPSLGYLFIEDESGEKGLGLEYWPRFRSLVRSKRPGSSIELELSYLVSLGRSVPVATLADHIIQQWDEKHDDSIIVEFLQRQYSEMSTERRTALLDILLSRFAAETQKTQDYAMEEMKRRRYDEIDDEVAAAYHLERLASDFAGENNPQWQRQQFQRQFAETALHRPLLVEKMAVAERADIRMLAVGAVREHPSPRFRGLLQTLLEDENPGVRAAASAAQAHWDELKAEMSPLQ